MSLEHRIGRAIAEKPLSGGALIERLQAGGEPLPAGAAVLVYGALANLKARGEAEVVGRGPGEVLWGAPGSPPGTPAPPGHPPSFACEAGELAWIEREIWRLTKGLPSHYFEELRRAVVADADRRVFHGAKLPRAVSGALAALGPPAQARRYLRRVERGGPVPLRLPMPRRWLVVPVACVLAIAVVRIFLVGLYTMPDESISMAPTLFPAREHGDRWVLAWLCAYWFDGPERGDLVVFRAPGRSDPLVKRVAGLPRESVAIRQGDLVVDGKRLVKERALLDRVRVPLFGLEDLEETAQPAGLRLPGERWHVGYRNADRTWNRRAGPCRDVVVRVRARARTRPGSLGLELDGGGRARCGVVFWRDESGARHGFASVGDVEVATGPDFRIAPGTQSEIWLTNADGLFRVEIDGREIARAPVPKAVRSPELAIHAVNAELVAFEAARDLVYEPLEQAPTQVWELGDGEYFVLGDNSPLSRDSRSFGPVRRSAVLGRIFAVAWPPERLRLLGGR